MLTTFSIPVMSATTQVMGTRFSDEVDSLRSTPDPLSTSSNPPSLKGRKPFSLPVSNLFGSMRRYGSNRGTVKMAIDSDLIVNEKAVDATAREPTPTSIPENTARSMSPTIILRRQTDPDTVQPPQSQTSKSQAMLRRFTTKLRTPSPDLFAPGNRSSNIPVPPNTLASKENREAALRERGLLPPKDLSVQEQERDRSLAVFTPVTDEDSGDATSDGDDDAMQMTAAIQIKQEWEARNKTTDPMQRDRINDFKSGASPSVQPGLEPVAEVDTPPSEVADLEGAAYFLSLPSDEPSTSLPSPNDAQSTPPPMLDFSIKIHAPPPSRSLPVSPSDPSFACAIPLPPSPVPSSTPSNDGAETPRPKALDTKVQRAVEAYSPSSPPSPLEENTPATARSFTSAVSDDTGSCTPKALEIQGSSTTATNLLASTPLVYFTPLASPSSAGTCSQDGSLAASSRDRSSSLPPLPSLSESESSMPSLCVDTESTSNSSESCPSTGRGRAGGLKVKTTQEYGVNNIPVIVESPVEGESILSRLVPNSAPADLDHIVVDESVLENEQLPHTKARGSTDPNPPANAKMERKKSINIFKRSQTLGPSSAAPSSYNPNKLSVSTSLGNLRRSVVGSLSRPKSTSPVNRRAPTKFDASHLPPSPTRFATSPGVMVRPRQPLGPTIYSRGSIVLEANEIEDDESRRLSELAFLG